MNQPNLTKKQQLLQSVKKGSRERNQYDLRIIQKCLLENEFIKQMFDYIDPRFLQFLCRGVHFQQYSNGQYIYKNGESAKMFYIILSGKVAILHHKFHIPHHILTEQENDIPIEIPDGLLINKFHEGGYFGDQGLRSSSEQRNTALALGSCEFLVFSSYVYFRIVDQYLDLKYLPLLDSLKQMSIFSSWSEPQIYQIIYSSQPIEYIRDDIVYSYDNQKEYIYFIIDGEVEIYFQQKQSRLSLRSLPDLFKRQGSIELPLVILSKNQYFGQYENNETVKTKGVCLSACHILKIHKKKLLMNFNSEQLKQFINEGAIRQAFEQQEMKTKQSKLTELKNKFYLNININESMIKPDLLIQEYSPKERKILDREAKSHVVKNMNLIDNMSKKKRNLSQKGINNFSQKQISPDRMNQINRYIDSNYFGRIVPVDHPVSFIQYSLSKNKKPLRKKFQSSDPEMDTIIKSILQDGKWKDKSNDNSKNLSISIPQSELFQISSPKTFITNLKSGRDKRTTYNQTFKIKQLNLQ